MDKDHSTFRHIRRLYRSAQRYSASHMKYQDLNPSELQLLRHIAFHGEVSQRHLAEELGVDKAMITRLLQRLEARGFISRKESETDARSKTIIALPPAMEVRLQAKEISDGFFDRLMEDVPPEDLEVFERVLEQLSSRARQLAKGEEAQA